MSDRKIVWLATVPFILLSTVVMTASLARLAVTAESSVLKPLLDPPVWVMWGTLMPAIGAWLAGKSAGRNHPRAGDVLLEVSDLYLAAFVGTTFNVARGSGTVAILIFLGLLLAWVLVEALSDPVRWLKLALLSSAVALIIRLLAA